MKMIYIIVPTLILIGMVCYGIVKMKGKEYRNSNSEGKFQDFFISPSSVSAERASSLLPTKGSEDATHILGEIKLPEPTLKEGERDYLPDNNTGWVISVEFQEITYLTPVQIGKEFGKEFRQEVGGMTIYGYDPKTEHWTYVHAADGPEKVTKLKFAWDYFASWSDEKLANESKYEERLKAIEEKMKRFGKPVITASMAGNKAEKKSQELKQLHDKLNRDAIIVLQAPVGQLFDGRRVWDVMVSLGLRWGDMDLFHWVNESSLGDDSYFSVWTSTEPGYFLPEYIAANKVRIENLIFGYSIPRSYEPGMVFNSMYNAALYAQKRLGGDILDRNGNKLIKDNEYDEIIKIVEELKEMGFAPGVSSTLRLF